MVTHRVPPRRRQRHRLAPRHASWLHVAIRLDWRSPPSTSSLDLHLHRPQHCAWGALGVGKLAARRCAAEVPEKAQGCARKAESRGDWPPHDLSQCATRHSMAHWPGRLWRAVWGRVGSARASRHRPATQPWAAWPRVRARVCAWCREHSCRARVDQVLGRAACCGGWIRMEHRHRYRLART